MILLITDRRGVNAADLYEVNSVKDISRPGSSLTKLELTFDSGETGVIEAGTNSITILPNVVRTP